jgi:hypothetical protein
MPYKMAVYPSIKSMAHRVMLFFRAKEPVVKEPYIIEILFTNMGPKPFPGGKFKATIRYQGHVPLGAGYGEDFELDLPQMEINESKRIAKKTIPAAAGFADIRNVSVISSDNEHVNVFHGGEVTENWVYPFSVKERGEVSQYYGIILAIIISVLTLFFVILGLFIR